MVRGKYKKPILAESPELHLWLNVLMSGIKDVVLGVNDGGGAAYKQLHQKEAGKWLYSKDFAEICEICGFEAQNARKKIEELISRKAAALGSLGKRKYAIVMPSLLKSLGYDVPETDYSHGVGKGSRRYKKKNRGKQNA